MDEGQKRFRVIQPAGGPSKTKQSFKDECDINTVLRKWRKTGITTNVQLGTPVYEDFSYAASYYESVNAVRRAEILFDSLPARVRARVHNDPGELIAFVENPDNAEELVELGLLDPVLPVPTPPITNGKELEVPETEKEE